MLELVASPQQRQFGLDKRDTLPQYCLDCDVRFACHGGCPKDRFIETPDGEPGLNYLCAGYKAFFHHVDGPMQLMAELLRAGPRAVRDHASSTPPRTRSAGATTPARAASGRKWKHCHGAELSERALSGPRPRPRRRRGPRPARRRARARAPTLVTRPTTRSPWRDLVRRRGAARRRARARAALRFDVAAVAAAARAAPGPGSSPW